MTLLKPITQKQFIATISDISSVYWMVARGGRVSREKVQYATGNKGLIQNMAGFTSIEDLSLSKSFDPEADASVITWVQSQIDNPTIFSVQLQPVKADLAGSAVVSNTIRYDNCQVVSYKLPDMDRNSSGLAMFELTLIVNELPVYS